MDELPDGRETGGSALGMHRGAMDVGRLEEQGAMLIDTYVCTIYNATLPNFFTWYMVGRRVNITVDASVHSRN